MADTRVPLHLTASEAANWLRMHPEDHGREIVIVAARTAPSYDGPWPPRRALGWNAAGDWVWEDDAEGRWP